MLLGRVLGDVEPLSKKSWNAVYRGDVLLDDDKIYRGFIKDLDERQLANELLAAVLGKGLGVSVPRSALVAVSKNASDKFSKIPHSNGDDFVAFCSVDVGGATVAQVFSSSAPTALPKQIKDSPGMGWMYGFDTWVANVDRHMDNIIVSGRGAPYLIDHGHCFSGPNWSSGDLNATNAYTNRLAHWLTPRLSEAEIDAAMSDVAHLVSKMASTDVQQAVSDALSEQFFGANDSDAVVGFLEARVEQVTSLSAKALGTLV